MMDRLVLLQTYWKQSDPTQEKTFLVFLGVAAAGLLVFALVKSGLLSKSSPAARQRAFDRAARSAGMDYGQTRLLDEYAKSAGKTDPEVFLDPAKTDAFFKAAYHYFEKNSESEADAEAKKSILFAARERMNRGMTGDRPIRSTRQLGRNTPLTLGASSDESYPSVILAVEPQGIAVEPMRDAYDEVIRFRRGSKLHGYFFVKGRQGYKFETRMNGWGKIGDKEAMFIAHNDEISALPSRRHERREMRLSCSFYRVIPASRKPGGKEKETARVEKVPSLGTIVDISAGGAGIQSATPLQEGEFLKVDFDPGNGPQTAFGRVMRSNRMRSRGGMMHVQFVKVPQRSLNAILSYVYGYSD
jgi:c-di-GMP-binding flagellar brake protein YcgR